MIDEKLFELQGEITEWELLCGLQHQGPQFILPLNYFRRIFLPIVLLLAPFMISFSPPWDDDDVSRDTTSLPAPRSSFFTSYVYS